MAPEGWKIYKLGEISKIVGGGTPSTLVSDYWDGMIPWLTPKDLTNYRYKYIIAGERSITERGLNNSSTRLLPKGSILLTSRAPIGYLAIAENPICTNQGFKSLIADETKVNTQFLYYLLKKNIEQIKSYGTGTTFAEVSGSTLKGIKFAFPESLPIQSRIGSILSSLDDKIELNLQMNMTLESIDFRFPDFDGKLVDGLPKGWKYAELGEIADVVDCLHSKKPVQVQYDSGNVLLQLNNILDSGLLDTSEKFYISDADYKKWISRIEVSEGDCIITNVGRVGAIARIPKGVTAALGRNMTGLRLKEDFKYPGFFIQLLVSRHMKAEIKKNIDVGTILNAINVKNIPKLRFPLGSQDLIEKYDRIATNIRHKMEDNMAQNHTLSKIRDSLLPKLMSGKIRV